MRTHTNNFKVEIAKMGRQATGKIYHYFNYVVNAETNDKIITENNSYLILEGYNKNDKEELTNENIYSMKLIKNGELLQSLMKQFNFEAKYNLRIGDVINPHFGLLVNDEYEFLDYGDYIIYSKQYNANNDTWDYVCYDLMLYSMIQYNGLNISYPITVKNYINAIANKMGVGFANINDAFTNSDELIYKDLFKDKNKTYRDILDKLAEITASNILINDNNELEVYYPKYAGEIADMSNSSIEITNSEKAELQKFELEGKTTQENEPTPSNPSDLVSVGYENLINKEQIILGYFRISDGTYLASTSATYKSTELIPISPSTKYYSNVVAFSSSAVGVTYWNDSGTFISGSALSSNHIYTTPSNAKYMRLSFKYANSDITDINTLYLIKGTQAHSYIPYGKYGIEVKTNGKNWFDKDNVVFVNKKILNNSGEEINDSTGGYTKMYIEVLPNTEYTISGLPSRGSKDIYYFDNNKTYIGHKGYFGSTYRTFTTPSNCKYIDIMYYISGNDFNIYQLELGSTATTYEEYKSNTYLYTLDNPLRSIGNIKDLLYIKNGMLYVDRKIGSVVLDGSEDNWNTEGDNAYIAITDVKGNNTKSLSNNFIYTTTANNLWGYMKFGNINNNLIFYKAIVEKSSLTGFKSWLSTHNTEVQYELAEPYTEELGQVDMPSTYKGITYIETTDNNEPTMNITYISEFEEIDEKYLKDINVNFGEKFGQINRVVLRDTENKIEYVAQDNISIEKNKLTQINIIDNPITLNGNEDNICQNILNKLNGLYYSINDFTNTGLCYYDFLDIFFVKIKDTRYQCLLLNNEITITQGIEETIFTDARSNSQVEGGNYETNYLTNKDIQTKITQLNDTKVESKSVINSINDSKEKIVISAEKIMYIKDFTGTTDANGFLDIELNSDFVVCSATANFNSNDYGFVIPYYDYNNGSPKWKLKIKDKNDVAVANTQIATTIYYFKKERND